MNPHLHYGRPANIMPQAYEGGSMKGKHCKLYDEQLVKNIMISAGLMTLNYLKDKKVVDKEDICEFIEVNADSIIEDTLSEMDDIEPKSETNPFGESSDFWNE
jgi:hypothetical protein